MKTSSILILRVLILLAFVSSHAKSEETSSISQPPIAENECLLPLTEMNNPITKASFTMNDLFSRTQGLSERISGRYIVADLNTTDSTGLCRGVEEVYPNIEQLSDFPEMRKVAKSLNLTVAQVASFSGNALDPQTAVALENLKLQNIKNEINLYKNLVKQVESFRKESPPLARARTAIAPFGGQSVNLCLGQRIALCEIRNGTPTLVARFVTSSAKGGAPARTYYAEMNEIVNTRWNSRRTFGAEDLLHDQTLGWPAESGHDKFIKFHGKWEMPNFLNWNAAPGFKAEPNNGIHEIAGGLDSGGAFGAPVSLGCFRLRKYTSIFTRWFTPKGAKLFIHYSPQHYRTRADAKGKGI
jgi:hypothetical protein